MKAGNGYWMLIRLLQLKLKLYSFLYKGLRLKTFSLNCLRRSVTLAGVLSMVACAPNSAQAGAAANERAQLCLISAQQFSAGQGTDADTDTNNAITINAELALDHASRSRGLMHRESLAEDAGMLFYYPRAEYRGFWMFQTLIPLDIAFLNDQGRILNIQTMEPCMSANPSHCQGYQSDAAARAALELNAGAFAQYDINAGDYVLDARCEQSPWAQDWD